MESKKIEIPLSKRILKNVLKIIFIPLLWAIPLGFLVTILGNISSSHYALSNCANCVYEVPFLEEVKFYDYFCHNYEGEPVTDCYSMTFREAFGRFYMNALPIVVSIFWVILLIVFVIYKTFRIKLKE